MACEGYEKPAVWRASEGAGLPHSQNKLNRRGSPEFSAVEI